MAVEVTVRVYELLPAESFIHGTVVANTDLWVFFIYFSLQRSQKNPHTY